ncbi:MAG: hypothetical protein P8P29_08240, partial [Flavobacteriaceae bacterium]|nr:hypothetical protein [Flavobacteriaceae bacterium]
ESTIVGREDVYITTDVPVGNFTFKMAIDTVGIDTMYINNNSNWDRFESGGSAITDGVTIIGAGEIGDSLRIDTTVIATQYDISNISGGGGKFVDGINPTHAVYMDGNVGIGTTTPDRKLDIENGTLRLSDLGGGTFTGTETYLLGVEADGDVVEVDPSTLGGGGSAIADGNTIIGTGEIGDSLRVDTTVIATKSDILNLSNSDIIISSTRIIDTDTNIFKIVNRDINLMSWDSLGNMYSGSVNSDIEAYNYFERTQETPPLSNKYALRGNMHINMNSNDVKDYASVLGYSKVLDNFNHDLVRGVYGGVQTSGTGIINKVVPMYSIYNNGLGGNISAAVNLWCRGTNNGSITEAVGVEISSPDGTGTITNYAGLTIQDPTASGNTVTGLKYGIKNAVVGENYMIGSLALGSNESSAKLDILGTTNQKLIELNNGSRIVGMYVGDGTPEGVITATPSSLFFEASGGAQKGLYVKKSGSGNTGWSNLLQNLSISGSNLSLSDGNTIDISGIGYWVQNSNFLTSQLGQFEFVGIGSQPDYTRNGKLQVDANLYQGWAAHFRNTGAVSNRYGLYVESTGADAGSKVLQVSTGGNGVNSLLLNGRGFLGVGTAPSYPLHMKDAIGTYFFESTGTQSFFDFQNNTNRFRFGINPDGGSSSNLMVRNVTGSELYALTIDKDNSNLGIGVNDATQKLHVNGSARITGAIYDSNNDNGTSGQVLSSTVTGTDWIDAQDPAAGMDAVVSSRSYVDNTAALVDLVSGQVYYNTTSSTFV